MRIQKQKRTELKKCCLFIGVLLLVSSCILPQSGTSSSRFKTYRRPVDVENRIKFHVNQVGYDAHGPKQAIVESVGKGSTFDLIDASTNRVVYTGKLIATSEFEEWGGGPYYHVADFSEYTSESIVKIKIKEYTSHAFKVQRHVLHHETFAMVLDYFTQSRADHSAVLRADANVPFFNSERRVDLRGGWYDASGDISKYLSHLSYANFMNPQQIPLTVWALAWVHDNASENLVGIELKKRIAEEAVWGADYLVRCLDDAGYFYLNVFDHWSGDMYQRNVCAFETDSGVMTTDWQAGFREGGGLAIAALARVSSLGVHGDFDSEKYLNAAIKGFSHLQKNNLKYVDDGKENIIDDYTALLAATELNAVTHDVRYLQAASKRAERLIGRVHVDGYFVANENTRPFWHASDAGFPVVALTRYLDVTIAESEKQKVKSAIATHLSYLLEVTTEVPNPFGVARQHFSIDNEIRSGFFIPHQNESGYWWQGENARLASLTAAAALGGSVLADEAQRYGLKSFAVNQLNWILGMNPFGYCFLKGAGTVNPEPYAAMPNHKNHGDVDGGIANGITGSNASGEGIEFWGASGMGVRYDHRWRWLEQWLPHSTWYLVAITALPALD